MYLNVQNLCQSDLFKALFTRGTFIQPHHSRLEHHLLVRHVEKVTSENFCQLVHAKRKELLLVGKQKQRRQQCEV